MPAGIWRAEPFTKTVRCAWMWNSVCSLVWQLIPSTGWPVAAAVLASGGPAGIGTPSGPSGPAAGAGLRVPSVLSGASDSPLPELPPPVTASVMPTAAAMITTAAPVTTSHSRRRRRASWARISAIRSWARCRLLLLIGPVPSSRFLVAGSAGARRIGRRFADGSHGRPHDPGIVQQGRRDDARADAGQPRHPLVRLLADAAAHDDKPR
jgi:hypothetical protein